MHACASFGITNKDTCTWQLEQLWVCTMQTGRDALAKAPTGSGKTLAYLAAIIHDLQSQEPHLSRAEGTYAIIMAPTRELCIQICDVLTLILRRFIWLVIALAPLPEPHQPPFPPPPPPFPPALSALTTPAFPSTSDPLDPPPPAPLPLPS